MADKWGWVNNQCNKWGINKEIIKPRTDRMRWPWHPPQFCFSCGLSGPFGVRLLTTVLLLRTYPDSGFGHTWCFYCLSLMDLNWFFSLMMACFTSRQWHLFGLCTDSWLTNQPLDINSRPFICLPVNLPAHETAGIIPYSYNCCSCDFSYQTLKFKVEVYSPNTFWFFSSL